MTAETLAAAILRDVPRYEPDNPLDNAPSMKADPQGDWLSHDEVRAALTRALSDDLVGQAGAALEGVTPGPWEAIATREIISPSGRTICRAHLDERTRTSAEATANARFIAWCREGVPALLARNAALEVELQTVLDRESATQARHDARAEHLEAALTQIVEKQFVRTMSYDQSAQFYAAAVGELKEIAHAALKGAADDRA